MKFYTRKTRVGAAVCLLSVGLLTGCGSSEDNTVKGMQLVEELDYQGAIAAFEEAENAGENIRLIARGKGLAYMGMTDYEQAISCFQESLSASSGFVENMDYDINYYLAAALTKNEQYEDAEETYDAILALRPEEKDAYFLRGNVRLAQSDYEGAKADFDKVISMDYKNYDRLIKIHQMLAHYGYREVGLEYLQSALDRDVDSMSAHDKGRIFYYMGEYQKAALSLEEAKEKGGAESYLYLGRSYEAIGEYNYAANVYNSYIAKDNMNAEIYNQLGLCEMARKDYQKALGAFQNAMKIENNGMMQTLLFNEVMAYEYLGDYQKAAVLIESYLKSYPDDEKAIREQQFLSTR